MWFCLNSLIIIIILIFLTSRSLGMQINNEHQKYKYPNALKSVNFKGQTIPIKQITDKGLKIASGAIGAIGLAGVVMNNSLNSPNEIEDKLQGLTKQQIDLCTNSDGEISIEAIELLKNCKKVSLIVKILMA